MDNKKVTKMKAGERQAFGLKASSWCKVIAWGHIVLNMLMLCFIGMTYGRMEVELLPPESSGSFKLNPTEVLLMKVWYYGMLIIPLLAMLGIVASVKLHQGISQKRVTLLWVWMAFEIFFIVYFVVLLMLTQVVQRIIATWVNEDDDSLNDDSDLMIIFIIGLGLISISMFSIGIVFVHMKDIEDGHDSTIIIIPYSDVTTTKC